MDSAHATGAKIAIKLGLESQKQDKLLKITIDNPGSSIELGSATLFLRNADDHKQNTTVNLSSKLKIKKRKSWSFSSISKKRPSNYSLIKLKLKNLSTRGKSQNL